MPMVYGFERFDISMGCNIASARKATRELIDREGLILLEGTGEDVPADKIDENGFYPAKA